MDLLSLEDRILWFAEGRRFDLYLGPLHMNPGQWTTQGQALPYVHMIICCCPGTSLASSDHYELIWIPLVLTQVVTENEF